MSQKDNQTQDNIEEKEQELAEDNEVNEQVSEEEVSQEAAEETLEVKEEPAEEAIVVEDEPVEEVTEDVVVTEEESVEDAIVPEDEPVEEVTEEELEEIEEVIEENKEAAIPDFRAGDTVRVLYKIIEGDKSRIQPYEGIVIAKKGKGVSKTFIVRRIGADNIGIERIFPLYSPNIVKLEVKRRGRVRRAKLYYLRDKKGRAAIRVKERRQKIA